MKILITGTNGFIGKNLLNEIRNVNEILEINEDIFNSDNWLQNLLEQLNLFKPEIVFHIGACSDTLEQDVNYMMLVNYLFTKELSDWCKLNNSNLIYSSSAANYGVNGVHPSNLYGWSKFVAEQYVILNGGIGLRYFNVYGPLENEKGKMASVAYQMIEKNKNGEDIKLFPLKPKRDFVYIKDVIRANYHAMLKFNSLSGKWYEVGSGTARTFEDVLDILKIKYEYTSEKEIPEGYQFFTESNKTKWMPGWTSIWDLESGLNDYVNYLV